MTTSEGLPERSLLARREIEARIVGPIIRACQQKLGAMETIEAMKDAVFDLGLAAGADQARYLGAATLEGLARCLKEESSDGSVDMEVVELTADRLFYRVTRCKFAEMYIALGMADLGIVLSCHRDHGFVAGYDPSLTLEHRKTLMLGDSYCEICIQRRRAS